MSLSNWTVLTVLEAVEQKLHATNRQARMGLFEGRRLIRMKLSNILKVLAKKADGPLADHYTWWANVALFDNQPMDCAYGLLPTDYEQFRSFSLADTQGLRTGGPVRVVTTEDWYFYRNNTLTDGYVEQPLLMIGGAVQAAAGTGTSHEVFVRPRTAENLLVHYRRSARSIGLDGGNDTDVFDLPDEHVEDVIDICVRLLSGGITEQPAQLADQLISSELATKGIIKQERIEGR